MKLFNAPMKKVWEFDGFWIEPITEFSTQEIANSGLTASERNLVRAQ